MNAAVPSWLYLWYAAGLTVLVTWLNPRRLAQRFGDYRAYISYFVGCFALLAAVPAVVIAVFGPSPLLALASVGLTFGKYRIGLLVVAAAVPLGVLANVVLARDRTMAGFYPFSKQACAGPGKFAAYETAYFLFYYTAWEFAFRGVLFFPLAQAAGLWPAIALQTALSTLLHIGHPDTEVRGALVGGVALGLLANATGSFFYPLLLHAGLGISHDIVQYRRLRGRLVEVARQ